MALDSNAMLLLSQAKSHLGITGAGEDSRIEDLIAEASTWMESWAKRKLSIQTITEYQDGRAMNRILTREYPITGGPATGGKPEIFQDGDWVFDSTTRLDEEDYDVSEDGLTITLKNAFFSKGYRNIKITYEFGVGLVTTGTSTNTFPRDLQLCCKKLVEWLDLHRTNRRIGQRSKAKGGESVSYELDMPLLCQRILEMYVREEFNAGNVGIRNQ